MWCVRSGESRVVPTCGSSTEPHQSSLRSPTAAPCRLKTGPEPGRYETPRRERICFRDGRRWRRVLALYLSRHRESIRIVTLPGGKPTFVPEPSDERRLSFSSGHSGDVFCLAVGTATSVGVDVELERPVPLALAIAARWFSPAESDSLRRVQQARLSDQFLRLWTAKEALAKRHSAGLRLMRGPVDELDVQQEVTKNALVHFTPRAGYVASLASTSSIDDIRLVSESSRHI